MGCSHQPRVLSHHICFLGVVAGGDEQDVSRGVSGIYCFERVFTAPSAVLDNHE